MIIYGIISTIIFLIILPFYYIIRACKGKYLYGWDKKLGFFNAPDFKNKKVLMFHGVSVGEVIALENLIKKAKITFPECKIIVTTGTKTGQDIAIKKYQDIADFITYFPYDIPFCVRNFLSKLKPSVICIAETEIWPNFAYNCYKRNIPLLIINGRISDSTYKLYKVLKPFFKGILKFYEGIYTQSQNDNEKFISVGSNPLKTEVMKNLKFDVKRVDTKFDLAQENYRVIIAGSTHHEENELILNIFSKLKIEFSDIKLLIAPRHLNRVENISEICKNLKIQTGYRSKGDKFDKNDVIILDTLGELSKIYTICDFAFIGGSFNKTGGHNPLEAAVYEKPTLSGPSIHNFRDIYNIIDTANAGKVVKNEKELENFMRKLLYDKEFYLKTCENCKNVLAYQQGALDFVIEKLKKYLK